MLTFFGPWFLREIDLKKMNRRSARAERLVLYNLRLIQRPRGATNLYGKASDCGMV
jgi:hypothetical protein